MHEKLSRSQEQTAINASRRNEEAWRVFTHASDHTIKEVNSACRLLIDQMKNLQTLIDVQEDNIYPEIYDRVFMGIYHHGNPIPPELKYKDPHRN